MQAVARFEIDAFSKIEPRLLKEYVKFRDSIVEEDTSCNAPYFVPPSQDTSAGGVEATSIKSSSDDYTHKTVATKTSQGTVKLVKVKKKVDPIFELEKNVHEDRDRAFEEAAAALKKMEEREVETLPP